MPTNSMELEDQYAAAIRSMLNLYHVSVKEIHCAVIGSVVPPITEYLRLAIKRLFSFEALVVKYDTDPDLKIAIQNPKETGADLILSCVAAKEKYPAPCIIIDMGTATKCIVLDKDQRMLGGCIIPGMGISLRALFRSAALLTTVEMEAPDRVIGDSTVSCIQSGSIYGSAAMLDNLCSRMEKELGTPCTVVATGGFAEKVIPHCEREICYDKTLVLDGLRLIHEKVRGKG